MTDLTDDEHREAARAAQAETELRETEKAFEALRAGFFETIAQSGLEESALREKCYLGVMVIDGVKQMLASLATSKAVVEHTALIRGILKGEDKA